MWTGWGNTPYIVDLNKVRKLTPIECERLQTLPDNYTAWVSDTQRYKMLGNWWTVGVIAHIFSYLK
jgi:site-specific DNA-cytosine methylase